MSESASTVVYLIIAVITFAIAGWKFLALLRDPTPTLTLIASTFLCSGAVYVLAAPAVYRALGEALGQPSVATLPVYVGILFCFAHLHLLTLLWNPQLQRSPTALRRRLTAWAVAYTAAAVLMVALFCSADLSRPADPLQFNTVYAQDPVVLLFLAVFLATLTSSTLSTFRQSRRMSLEDSRLQHAVRSFGIAMLFVFGYVVCWVPAIALAAFGNHALDGVGVFGSSFGATGALIASYGLSGAAVSSWLRERRDIRALQPLWDLVVEQVDQDLAFSANSARSNRLAANVSFNLHRRVIEILDGMRALRPWVSAGPAQAVYSLQKRSDALQRPSVDELEAIATAAALRDAVERLQHTRRETAPGSRFAPQPDGPPFPLPGEGTRAADERERLLRVAQALTHPLVAEALSKTAGNRTEVLPDGQ
ncbi:MAB_1171c family putative transporter [Streptomyces sp. NPDC051907]|uniref:MAB_1171c family putative transporter n=1 Tax=Streptomyces sp. NPDC051907 TaxID=3155284 RepID=UPI00344122A6